MLVLALSSEIFQNSTSHLEEKDKEMIQSDTDPGINHLNIFWDIHFEKRQSPTEDKMDLINLGSEANPKPIFVSESFSPSEKEDYDILYKSI